MDPGLLDSPTDCSREKHTTCWCPPAEVHQELTYSTTKLSLVVFFQKEDCRNGKWWGISKDGAVIILMGSIIALPQTPLPMAMAGTAEQS